MRICAGSRDFFNAALICAAVSTTTFFSICCSTLEFGLKESRCFYNLPSGKTSYDVVATLWVTEEQANKGLAAQLYQEMTAWLAKSWPLQTVAWPGREIPPARPESTAAETLHFTVLHNVFHRQYRAIETREPWHLSRFDLISYHSATDTAFFGFPRLKGLVYPQLYFWFFNSTTITSIG